MIAQDFILKHIPFGDRIERNGNTYYYEVIDSKTGSFRLKTNSGDYEATSFSAFPDELKIGCEEVAIKQAEVKARSVETELRLNTITAWWSQIPKPKRNREAVADLFILFHKDRLCYSHELRQWLIYNGKFWDFDKAEAVYNFLIGFNKDIIKWTHKIQNVHFYFPFVFQLGSTGETIPISVNKFMFAIWGI